MALLAWSPVAAGGEPVRLHLVRLPGTGPCIDAATLEARVRERLGSDPFDARASRAVEAVIRRSGDAWTAEIAVRAHPRDLQPPSRELKSQSADCAVLSESVVLAVALAIDPAAAFSAAPRPAAALATPSSPPVVQAAPPPGRAAAGRAELAMVAQAGLLPRASLGAGVGAAAALGERLEIAVRAQIFPAVEVAGNTPFTVGLARGDVRACVRLRRLGRVDAHACGGPSLGLLDAALLSGDRAQPGQRAWVAAAAALEATVALAGAVAVRVGFEGVLPLTRYRFTIAGSDATLFRQLALAATADVGVQVRFGSAR
ncbi:MAG: hypothetical protein ACJ8F1_03660 [Polyangia bacterium]